MRDLNFYQSKLSSQKSDPYLITNKIQSSPFTTAGVAMSGI